MSARITMNLTSDGVLELWLNEEGTRSPCPRTSSARYAQRAFSTWLMGRRGSRLLQLSTRAYRPTDTVLEAGKVMLRTDEWDRTYFPHVMGESA